MELYNQSLLEGIFPECLKKAIIIPVHKGGTRTEAGNYRPIALVSIFSKLFETLVLKTLKHFLNKHSFFSKYQYGFLEGRGTELALISFTNQIIKAMEEGKYITGLFLDIAKAFDTLSHDVLLGKMYNAGVRGSALKWFESYMTNRKQQVKVQDELSQELELQCGVPQGSVLSPTLFLIYINDLCDSSLKGMVAAFADDTAILYKADTKEDLLKKIQFDLKILTEWFSSNELCVNVKKTKFVNFSVRNQFCFSIPLRFHSVECKYTQCNCNEIEQVESIKYLGLTFDQNMTWKTHIFNLK